MKGRWLCHHLCMAKTVIVKLTDDIDGGDADETVQFALDGRSYEMDLSAANASKLREAFKPFIENGRAGQRESRPARHGPVVRRPRTRSIPSSATTRRPVSGLGPTCRRLDGSVTPGSRVGWRPESPDRPELAECPEVFA